LHIETLQLRWAFVGSDRAGWPGMRMVGAKGAEAAWLVAQHAISRPSFQRRCLELLRGAVRRGDVPPKHVAYLVDRIRSNERRPQVFGTQLDWDENGDSNPWEIESPETVDERRGNAGLEPIDEAVRRARVESRQEGARAPMSVTKRRAQIESWAKKIGWLDDTE
jgi:hypothetical protein